MDLNSKLAVLNKWSLINKDGMAIKEGPTGDGDSLLWSGLLSLVGVRSQSYACNHCIDNQGRLWRSTKRVGKEEYNSFSRDMEMGFLAHVVGYPSHQTVRNFKNHCLYIKQNKQLAPLGDNRVKLTPSIAGLINIVSKRVEPTTIGSFWRFFHGLIMLMSAITSPKGYPMHLVGVHLLIRQELKYGRMFNYLTSKILEFREPKNIFFMVLADCHLDDVLETFYSQVPWEEPKEKSQWSQERAHSEHAYVQSMCWDFMFLILLIKKRYHIVNGIK